MQHLYCCWQACILLTYQLDVSVYHTNLVAVVQGYDQLLEKPSGFIFLKPISLLDILKHIASRSKLHCDAKELIGQEHLFELYDVRMQQPVVVEQFPLNILCDLHAKVVLAIMPGNHICSNQCPGRTASIAEPSEAKYLLASLYKLDRNLLVGSAILAQLDESV